MSCATLGLSGLLRAEDLLPKPALLSTTKAIHELISKQPDPAADAMKPFTDKVSKAGDASIDLVPIPGGEFTIGSPESEAKRTPAEGPQRKLKIEPFWMAKMETTWGLYQPFMENKMARNKDGTLNRDSNMTTSEPPEQKDGETLVDVVTQPTPPYVPMNFGMGDGYAKDFPAIGITQHAASKFCEWLSAQTGHFYRLPTEAEWEYACRAGTTTAYSFGDDSSKLDEFAWSAGNSEFQYQKVGTKKPNPWGLYDMHGNVTELCLGQYQPDAYAAMKDGDMNPWVAITNRYPTVVRGGSWNDDPDKLRSAARRGSDPAWKAIDPQLPKSQWYFTNAPWLGFRVIRPLKTPSVEEMHRFWNMDGESE
ncbi:MAG: formylglycine-generating enzyme family protein [Verrucomicrobiales bacterium]